MPKCEVIFARALSSLNSFDVSLLKCHLHSAYSLLLTPYCSLITVFILSTKN